MKSMKLNINFLIKNNVIILYKNKYQKYIEEKYGKNYLKDFKEKN